MVRQVCGDGVVADRDLHVRIRRRPRAVTDRRFAIALGRGSRRCANRAEKDQTPHRNGGHRAG